MPIPVLHAVLGHMIRLGRLTVHYPDGSLRTYAGTEPGPDVGMALRTPRAVRRLVLNPSLAFGEAYMDGEIEPIGCSLYDLLRLLVLNHGGEGRPAGTRWRRRWSALRWMRRRVDQLNPAPRARAQRRAPLRPERPALCPLPRPRPAVFLRLFPDRAGDAGGGAGGEEAPHRGASCCSTGRGWRCWTSAAAGAAWRSPWRATTGRRVTGITLLEEQLRSRRRRAAEAGVADRVRFELLDYRAWTRPVDRIVSVGMFEHVGIGHYHDASSAPCATR